MKLESIQLGDMRVRVHPGADVFPLVEGEEFDALVQDIRDNGLQEPVILTGDKSTLVDGRNRARACAVLGIGPNYKTLPGSFREEDLLGYIVSANLRRRQLNPGQAAMVASDLVPLFEEAAKERQRAAGAMYGEGHSKNGSQKEVVADLPQPLSKNGSQKEVPADLPEANRRERKAREQAAKAVGAKGRNVSTGARAMATALVLQADGRRENGRWTGWSNTFQNSVKSSSSTSQSAWSEAMRCCGVILDHAPHLATDVPQDRGIPPKLLGDPPISRGGNPGFWISGARAMSTARVWQADGRRIQTKSGSYQWRDGTVRFPVSGNTSKKTWQNALNECGVILDYAPHLAADVAQADGRRENGRWRRGSVVNPETGINDGKTWQNLLNQCGVILDHAPHLAADVAGGWAAGERAVGLRRNPSIVGFPTIEQQHMAWTTQPVRHRPRPRAPPRRRRYCGISQ